MPASCVGPLQGMGLGAQADTTIRPRSLLIELKFRPRSQDITGLLPFYRPEKAPQQSENRLKVVPAIRGVLVERLPDPIRSVIRPTDTTEVQNRSMESVERLAVHLIDREGKTTGPTVPVLVDRHMSFAVKKARRPREFVRIHARSVPLTGAAVYSAVGV